MTCLILAAGYATRLYPLTLHFPKPLLPVAGRPILDWLIDDVETTQAATGGYVVVTNHCYAAHFEEWARGKSVRVAVVDDGTTDNENRLGAVADIQYAIDTLHLDDDLLVMAGDNLLDFSLSSFVAYARERGTSCVMRYHEPAVERLKRCGVAEVDELGRVLHMEEKPQEPRSHWCVPPFYWYTRADVQLVARGLREGCGADAPGSYTAWLCRHAAVHAMEMPGHRYDIGTLESYEQVKRDYRPPVL